MLSRLQEGISPMYQNVFITEYICLGIRIFTHISNFSNKDFVTYNRVFVDKLKFKIKLI